MIAWTKEAIEKLGGEMPVILDNASDVPVEQIAATKPDLIIAVYSGITDEEYALLSKIAPTVAYPEKPWGTTWQDTIRITREAMGKKAEAEQLVADSEQFIRDTFGAHPEIAAKTFAGIAEYNNEVAVYAGLDARMQFLVDAGMVLAPSVSELDPAKGQSLYYGLSFELFDQLSTDILITYFDTEEAAAAFFARPTIANSVQVRKGAVASLVGEDYINSVSPPVGALAAPGPAALCRAHRRAARKAKEK